MFRFVVQLSHSLILVTESSNMAPHGKKSLRILKDVLLRYMKIAKATRSLPTP